MIKYIAATANIIVSIIVTISNVMLIRHLRNEKGETAESEQTAGQAVECATMNTLEHEQLSSIMQDIEVYPGIRKKRQ